MIYPNIGDLSADGYIECDVTVVIGRVRKTCRLTESGRAAHHTAAKVWATVLPYLNQSVTEVALAIGNGQDVDGDLIVGRPTQLIE